MLPLKFSDYGELLWSKSLRAEGAIFPPVNEIEIAVVGRNIYVFGMYSIKLVDRERDVSLAYAYNLEYYCYGGWRQDLRLS